MSISMRVLFQDTTERGNTLRVVRTTYRGGVRFDLREWYIEPASGELRPSRRGVSFTPRAYTALVAALYAAREEKP